VPRAQKKGDDDETGQFSDFNLKRTFLSKQDDRPASVILCTYVPGARGSRNKKKDSRKGKRKMVSGVTEEGE